jgi:quercetin dioxygenase-like cupin family protein
MRVPPRTVVDAPGLRVVVFRLAPGQEVPDHAAAHHVLMMVRSGAGELRAGERRVAAAPGDWLHAPPGVSHGFRAGEAGLEVLAVIATPGPPVRCPR